ncbi:hypothetical protein SMACR_09087 [Sordaria macrospora]|uniref:WGS project CABT00000000 data, contig 2.71 n=2 Tax=Sordaria macrospora TaxID=5147 RepID=F7WB80_SORMK|nr:uncharacterized protein SMAC_09087 [Sordaria macrospora k-hell]KAA8623983.1 hypothetical protein SMACR_09087 [Sordaria macrospora]WPJ59512.1 hypothetical protein SMAC4_09087 [Sordaria macrospora]CCC05413.1 unnamed protein product [Sordaria macrospora k-hell]
MPPIKTEPGLSIKTEPGLKIKSEHEARFDFSSIPQPPVPSAPGKQEDRKPEKIFERLRKAHFNIKPTEPSGFLCRKVHHLLFHSRGLCDIISVKVERISEHGHAPRPTVKQEQVNKERGAVFDRTNGQTKPPSPSTSSFGRSQPATYMSQVSSSAPALHNPFQHGFDMLTPKEQPTTVAHPVAPKGTSSPFFGSSSALTSVAVADSGLFGNTLSPVKRNSLFDLSTGAGSGLLKKTSPPNLPSFTFSTPTVPDAAAGLFGKTPPPANRSSLFGHSTAAGSGLFGKPSSSERPLLAATTKVVPEVIVIDSSPESSPTPSPRRSLSKERAAGK